MTASSPTPTTAPGGAYVPPVPAPAQLAPLLAWLVERAGIDAEQFAAVAQAAPDAVAPGAADPARLADVLASLHQPFHALALAGAALPPREVVWWALVNVRHAQQVLADRAGAPPVPGAPPALPPPAAQRAALAALERWMGEPSDAARRAAWDAGQAADLGTPAGAACAATFFTGGSIAAAHSPMAVPPPPGAHVAMAATAVLLAALQLDPTQLPALVRAAVAQASELARHLGGWEASATLAHRHHADQVEQHRAALAAAAPPPPAA